MGYVRSHYGFFYFMFDLLFGILTCGLWWVWILFKFLRTGGR